MNVSSSASSSFCTTANSTCCAVASAASSEMAEISTGSTSFSISSAQMSSFSIIAAITAAPWYCTPFDAGCIFITRSSATARFCSANSARLFSLRHMFMQQPVAPLITASSSPQRSITP